MLKYLPHSPDLASSDLNLFSNLENVSEKRFGSNEKVESN